MKDIAERSVLYYQSKYGESHFRISGSRQPAPLSYPVIPAKAGIQRVADALGRGYNALDTLTWSENMGLSNCSEGEFWVYENDPTNKACVHRGSCKDCNHGEGVQPERLPHNRWHGPYTTCADAFAVARSLEKRDTRGCRNCNPCDT